MSDTVKMYIRDLPEDLTKKVNQHIRLFAVTMLICDEDDSKAIPCSGTLCSIKNKRGIVTARHVWAEIAKHRYLLIMLGKVPHIVEVNLLDAIVPPIQSRNLRIDADIPDIAFIKLPAASINHLEDISKVFYSVDKRSNEEFIDFAKSSVGYFALFGTPLEWLDYDKKSVPSFIYNTYINDYLKYDGWDYQVMGINLDENPDIPRSYVGVSGGGIWKIKFFVSEDEKSFTVENPISDVSLVGVNFSQTAEKGRQIIGHGPYSIYKSLYDYIQ